MKKIKIFTLIFLAIVIILSILTFIKLPIKTITSKNIINETGGLISLNSSEKQSLLLLPTPKIEIINSEFSINNNFFETNISIPNLVLSRSIFDKENISLEVKKANLEKIKTNLFNNPILLEDEIENLILKITSSNNLTNVKSNKFNYKGADISFNAHVKDGLIDKISFSIDKLNIDELILLLDDKYQKFFKNINFKTLNLGGEYIKDTFVIEKFELILEDDSIVSLLGLIDLKNIFESNLKIRGFEIASKNIFQLANNLNFGYQNKDFPEGFLKNFEIEFINGLFKNLNFSYKSNLGTNLSVAGNINSTNIFDSTLTFILDSTSSEELFQLIKSLNLTKHLPYNIPLIQFDKLNLNFSLQDGLFHINNLNIVDGISKAKISGEIDINNFDKRSIKINLDNFNQFNLLPSSQLIKFFKSLNINKINLESILLDSELEIINFVIPFSENSVLTLAGDTSLINIEDTFLNVNLKNIRPNEIEIILNLLNNMDYMKYIQIINFDNMQGNIFLNLKNQSVVIEEVELFYEGNTVGLISGEISNNQFKGLIDFQKLDFAEMDKNFFKTDRIEGQINMNIAIPDWVSTESFLNVNGSLGGEVTIKASKDELALLMFIQSLSEDIEDFDQFNKLFAMVAESFVNQPILMNGMMTNEIENKIFIKDLTLTSPNGDNLFCEFIFENGDYKITIFNIIDQEDLVIKFENGSYSYERIIPDGTIKKPIEDLIQKNINKLFENLLQ